MNTIFCIILSFNFVFGQVVFIPYLDSEIEYRYTMPLDSKYCPGDDISDCIYTTRSYLGNLFFNLSQDKDYCELHKGKFKPWGSYIRINTKYLKSDCIYKDFWCHIKINYKGKIPIRFYID